MFARNALRAVSKPAFTTKSLRTLTTSSTASDNMNPHGVEISKAQRIAQDGFVSGMNIHPSNPPDHLFPPTEQNR